MDDVYLFINDQIEQRFLGCSLSNGHSAGRRSAADRDPRQSISHDVNLNPILNEPRPTPSLSFTKLQKSVSFTKV